MATAGDAAGAGGGGGEEEGGVPHGPSRAPIPDTVAWLKGGDLARSTKRLERSVGLEDSEGVLLATHGACSLFIGQTLGALAALCAMQESAALAPKWVQLEAAVDAATQRYAAIQVRSHSLGTGAWQPWEPLS